jgi:hypothetical protein
MDVHAPIGSVHGWRDFLVHLAIISLGLLIALGLEGVVGWARHKQLVHKAEADLRSELQANRVLLARNAKSLDAAERQAETDLAVLLVFRSSRHASGELKFYWEWSSLTSAAWDTAREAGAVSLMNYEKAQTYSETYNQQSLVNLQAASYIRDVYRSAAPLEGGRHLQDLQTSELDGMIANVQQTMADVNFLRDLSESLTHDFEKTSAANGH